ncbi:hypothetical protein HOY82DRAFT_592371 [Tuber indicum]|nr:hypothetical protein HOY82DRAFT_592371 [Tuber indicum]
MLHERKRLNGIAGIGDCRKRNREGDLRTGAEVGVARLVSPVTHTTRHPYFHLMKFANDPVPTHNAGLSEAAARAAILASKFVALGDQYNCGHKETNRLIHGMPDKAFRIAHVKRTERRPSPHRVRRAADLDVPYNYSYLVLTTIISKITKSYSIDKHLFSKSTPREAPLHRLSRVGESGLVVGLTQEFLTTAGRVVPEVGGFGDGEMMVPFHQQSLDLSNDAVCLPTHETPSMAAMDNTFSELDK